MGDTQHPPIDPSLRRVVVAFRLLGAAWLCLLAATVISDEPDADRVVILAAVATVVVWSGVTWWMASNHPDRFRSVPWVVIDGVVAVWIAISPFVADATHKFFGGYPMSWVFLAAYAGGVRYALPAGAVLAFSQIGGAFGQDQSLTSTVGDITVFVISAVLFGWALTTIRETDRRRHAAVRELEAERRERRIANEKAEIGAHLHDSVLQTLALIEQDTTDETSRALARSQDRDLRAFIERMASPHERSFAAELKAAAAKVEDERSAVIEVVVVGDCESDTPLSRLVDVGREAMVNAAKYGEGSKISVLGEVREKAVTVSVRDRGPGFDVEAVLATSQGLAKSVIDRVERHGGTASITSSSERGTEIVLRMPRGTTESEGDDD